jgi:hypothetical protein
MRFSSLLALLALASLARGVDASSKARAAAAAADARLSAADADALLDAAAAAANAAAATGEAAAGADTSAANPFSRAGLQGRRARLFAEERAKHVAFAAKWVVHVVLDAAFYGESNVTISNVADATPTPPAPNEHRLYNSDSHLLQMPGYYRRKQWQSGQNDMISEPEMLRRTSQRLENELDQLSRYEDSGMSRDEIEGGITLTPKVAREMADEKRRELDAVQSRLRRLDRVEEHERYGYIARSCLDDVARAVADELPGVSVEVQGASGGLYISWD